MLINDSMKPLQIAVDDDDHKLSRPGGAASKASEPVLQDTAGSKLAKMQSMLLGSKADLDTQNVKKLGGGDAGRRQRQFGTLASAQKAPAPKRGKGRIFRIK